MIANKDQIIVQAQEVKNSGNISSATSQVSLKSQNLNNSGLISSADELSIDQQEFLTNTGTLNAARIVLNAKNLKNSGSIEQTGTQSLKLVSASISNNAGRIGLVKKSEIPEGSGNNNTGNTVDTGSTEIKPNNPAKDGGRVESANDGSIAKIQKNYDTGYINVKEQLNNDKGGIVAYGVVDIDTNNVLENREGKINLGHIKVQGENFNNDQGQLTVQQADISTSTLSNQSGQITVNKNLSIQSKIANNDKGIIQTVERLDLQTADQLSNREGKIASGQQLSIQAGQVNNQSGLLYSEQANIALDVDKNLDNSSGIIQAKDQLNLNSQKLNNRLGQILAENIEQKHDSVENTEGSIVAKQNLKSIVEQFDNNKGEIQAQNIQFTHVQLNNSGNIYADQNLKIAAQLLQNAGTLSAGQNIQLNSKSVEHENSGLIVAGLDRQGKLGALGDLNIIADQVALHGKSFAGNTLNVQASLQSKDLDVSASGTNINVLQAEQANGKNLTTGHATDLSNTIQTQTSGWHLESH
ncbi:MAG: hypothetical protein GAK29_01053 [Acinetobacter bereziniae]|uniref:Hemolysin n=1 Tax=Acinetobacter bereziniae TaxID=106648 RepID=A0A833USW0_ACIBZ|nr:MAG: hypothetical protein GAK29_01053 [Acinetobacter bereziniae]